MVALKTIIREEKPKRNPNHIVNALSCVYYVTMETSPEENIIILGKFFFSREARIRKKKKKMHTQSQTLPVSLFSCRPHQPEK